MRIPTNVLIICLAVGGLLLAIGCDNQPKISDNDLVQLTDRQLVDRLEDGKKRIVLVDPRSPADYAAGHIPGAINIPLASIVANDIRLAEAQGIVVYASGWRDVFSAAAAKKMIALGYVNVMEFRGGIEAWRGAGRAVATADDPSPQAGVR